MTILQSLTIKNLKLNKKRTIVTVIGIMLATALIVALSSLVFSFKASIVEYEKKSGGDYHYKFSDVPNEEIKYIKDNRDIEKINITQEIGYAKLENSKNESKPYLYLQAFSKDAFENLSINLIEGKLPQNENEIVISNHIKTNGRVKYNVGDKITLSIGKRIREEYECNQNNPYIIEEEEHIEEAFTKTYTIVGIADRPISSIEPYSAPGYTILTYLNEDNLAGNVNIYARYTQDGLKNHNEVTANILGIELEEYNNLILGTNSADLEGIVENCKYDFEENSYLISYETLNFSDSLMAAIYSLAIIITIIIVITSVFCIRNSFAISITEKVKQYGMLASVGTTSKQIKKNVYFEALVLALIGIPLGVALGLFASFILIKICNVLLKEALTFELIYVVSAFAIIVSLVLSAITCLLSARSSARKAAKISPIEAIRGNEDIKIKSKKVKSPKFIKKTFGMGGDIAYKNLKRNRKKYRTTVISIVVCVAVFIATSSFVDLAFKSVKMEVTQIDYNISVYARNDGVEEFNQKINQIVDLEDIDKYTIQRETQFISEDINYTKEIQEECGVKSEDTYITVLALGKEEYDRYIKELGLSYDKCKDKAILINKYVTDKIVNNEAKKIEVDIYNVKKGDIVKGKISKNVPESGIDANLEICAVTDKMPMALYGGMLNGFLIISDELMDTYKNQERPMKALYIQSSNPDKLQDNIEKIVTGTDFTINNVNQQMKQMQSMFLLIAIFLYGFIAVIALIGITNIFNTITTSMELRSKEFAMLKSIGMTKKEFNKMVKLESFFYGTKSLLIGMPIGIGLSYLIFKALSQGIEFKYMLPMNGIIVSIIAVFILIWSIMKFSLNKINKQNIIETIRQDNI